MKLLIKKREKLGYQSMPPIFIDTLYKDNEDIPDEYIDVFSYMPGEMNKIVIVCEEEEDANRLKSVLRELQETERLKMSN
jgi:hypothetical protein